eukprot:365652-Chlamydomonas_euryale.AAC.12
MEGDLGKGRHGQAGMVRQACLVGSMLSPTPEGDGSLGPEFLHSWSSTAANDCTSVMKLAQKRAHSKAGNLAYQCTLHHLQQGRSARGWGPAEESCLTPPQPRLPAGRSLMLLP